jgi:tocopherol O-methyltransferase
MSALNQAISRYYDGMGVFYRWFYSGAGLHYGLWDGHTHTLRQALMNQKRAILDALGPVTAEDHVLDAGCGEGRTALYCARQAGCRVTGITLSPRQVNKARRHARRQRLSGQSRFLEADFTDTSFCDNSFTHAFASESFCHAEDKPAFLREMYRLLKPGGRLVIADFFLDTPEAQMNETRRHYLDIIKKGFVVPGFADREALSGWIAESGFSLSRDGNLTASVKRTAYHIQARAMLALPFGYLLRGLHLAPAEMIPHLLCCLAQPAALTQLGNYRLVTLDKPA